MAALPIGFILLGLVVAVVRSAARVDDAHAGTAAVHVEDNRRGVIAVPQSNGRCQIFIFDNVTGRQDFRTSKDC